MPNAEVQRETNFSTETLIFIQSGSPGLDFKWPVNVISSDPALIGRLERFTTVPLNALSD